MKNWILLNGRVICLLLALSSKNIFGKNSGSEASRQNLVIFVFRSEMFSVLKLSNLASELKNLTSSRWIMLIPLRFSTMLTWVFLSCTDLTKIRRGWLRELQKQTELALTIYSKASTLMATSKISRMLNPFDFFSLFLLSFCENKNIRSLILAPAKFKKIKFFDGLQNTVKNSFLFIKISIETRLNYLRLPFCDSQKTEK